MKDTNSNTCTFEASSLYVSMVNNSGIVGLFLGIISLVIYWLNKESLNGNILPIHLAVVVGFPYIFGLTQKKFAYKVSANFNNKTLSLSLFRSKQVIKVHFVDIKKIYIKGYIVFMLPSRKVYCNSAADKELIACLNRIMTVT